MYGLKKDGKLNRTSSIMKSWKITPAPCPLVSRLRRSCRAEHRPATRVTTSNCRRKETVVVSGIGCSSRFPHYMKTYGFHGLHGRAFPVACGVKSRRPDLHVFVVTGDGDCCAIGAGHWVHALRYNMDMTVILLDNNVYGLTKNQTSPTTRLGEHTNTHPHGAVIRSAESVVGCLGDHQCFVRGADGGLAAVPCVQHDSRRL